jgi:haloalkane dehalogenase
MPTWDEFHPSAVEKFKHFRTPGVGEKIILDENAFVERVLPGATVRKLTEEEMEIPECWCRQPSLRVLPAD